MGIRQKINIFVFIFIAFSIGFSVFLAANKDYFIDRDPASIPGKLFNFNNLNSEQLRAELESKIKIKPTFTAENLPSKSIVFAGLSSQICQSYSEIHIEFSGDGMSVAGEPTKMIIDVPCVPGQDPGEIAAILLPVQEILRQKPRDAVFTFSSFPGTYSFLRVTDEWPTVWLLQSVEFKNSTKGKALSGPSFTAASPRLVNFENIKSAEAQPIVLEF
jgi:hypothetical protein